MRDTEIEQGKSSREQQSLQTDRISMGQGSPLAQDILRDGKGENAWDEIKAIKRSRIRSRRHSLHGTSNQLGIDFTTFGCYVASYNSITECVQNVDGVVELGVNACSNVEEISTLKDATEQAIGASPGEVC